MAKKSDERFDVVHLHLNDHAKILVSLLEKCTLCKEQPATVINRHVAVSSIFDDGVLFFTNVHETKACDACAARVIVTSQKAYRNYPAHVDARKLLRSGDEGYWMDVSNAESVRRAIEYATMTNHDNERTLQ